MRGQIRTRTLVCTGCGIEFSSTAPRQKFCTKSCKNRYYFKRVPRANKDNYIRIAKENRMKLKSEVMRAYGNKCECCGEDTQEFLTIDHINGGGNKHRKSLGRTNGGGYLVYDWLKKNNYPKDNFQILCWNCNCGRRINGGICPHKENE